LVSCAIAVAQAQGQHEKSLKQAQRTLREVNTWSDDELSNRNQVVANLYSLIGNAHLEQGKYGKALEYHQKDLDISTQK
jgi:tetratricopeptide (TPR) repeat protein